MSLNISQTLELDKILDHLKGLTASSLGKERVDEMVFISDFEDLSRAQDETQEATQILLKRGNPPLVGIGPVSDLAFHASRGGTLSMKELLDVADSLRGARMIKKYLAHDEGDQESAYPILEDYIEALWTKEGLEKEIERVIVSEDEMADDASPKLRSLRRSIVAKRGQVRDKLDSIISGAQYEKALQDRIVTMREGRYVVPVKQNRRGMIPGLVHDMSSSGQTVFIEPMAVVELNNQIRTLELEEREEVSRILRELSQEVAASPYDFQANEAILGEVDFIFAKGKLALDLNATRPQVNQDRYTRLDSARHPLLDQEEVVPVDIELGKDYTSLIVTGPNTGGKTVSLKILGLLTLMTQYGLHIPARETSQVGVYQEVFADIGDDQSIEQSLSTFSSHMVNIVEIMDRVTEESLVLFDELGSGTDPAEGAALALAILETMRDRGIRTMATTHYNQLKTYAIATPGVQNASMEFDVDTLSPTFRMRIGMPGKSNAFEISRRLGLDGAILDRAHHHLEVEDIEFERVLESLEEEKFYLEKERREARENQALLEDKYREYDKEVGRVQRNKERIIKEAKEEAARILAQAKEEADLALGEIRDLGLVLEKDQARTLQESRDLLREGLEEARSHQGSGLRIKEATSPTQDLKPGDPVYAQSLGVEGTVLEIDQDKEEALVQAGIMKMNLPLASLVRKKASEEKPGGSTKTKQVIQDKQKNAKTEIDIRGMSFEEARPEIDRALDDAYLTGLASVRIIHGKGTGALRKKVRDYLKKHKTVASFKEAKPSEGGAGVTYANFKGD